ncbi:MAG: restriction endonuclease subunit S [Nitrosopumilaceae archaeon]
MNQKKFKQTEIGMIPEDWEVKIIDEIKSTNKSAVAMGPFGSNIKKELFVKEGVPIIRGNNLNSYRFLDEDFVYLTEEKADELRSSNCHSGDIVITHRGTLGQVGLIPRKSRHKRYVISQSGMKLSCDESRAISEYVFYFLKSPVGQRLLLRNTSQTGVPAIAQPLTSLKNVPLPVPDINEQKTIAKVFEDLNDKIDLLLKHNKTLEAIAKAIFKHWFIDFEFPNEEGKPYKSSGGEMIYNEDLGKRIPDGWEIKSMDGVVTVKGGSTPSTKNSEYWDNGKINWCTPKDLSKLNSPVLLDTERKITESGLLSISSDLLPIGTVLLSSRAPIGYLAISEIPVAVNQGFIAIVCDKIISKYFMLFWLQHNMDEIESRAHGTTFEEINKTSFRNIRILVPRTNIVNNYDKLMHALYCKIVKNEKESKTLTYLRDSLLPKLMSGKIRVPVEVK